MWGARVSDGDGERWVRNACSIGPNCARGLMMKGIRTMFFQYSLPNTSSQWIKGVEGVEGL